jgi:xylulokinase
MNLQSIIMVIDIGLTNCKVVLFSGDGHIVDRATIPYPTYHQRSGWVEQAPTDWWEAIRTGLSQIRARSASILDSIDAISVTGHMHSLVCIDHNGEAIGNSLVLGDQRSVAQSDAIIEQIGLGEIYSRTGARMDASMPMAKIAWIRENEPDRFRATSHFVTCKDYLRMHMTGDRLTDVMDATGMSLYNIRDGVWDTDLCRMIGIDISHLPSVVECTQSAGKLLPDPANSLRIKPGIPVVVGAGDDVEVLGFGLDRPGTMLEHLGTTGSILACSERPLFDPEMAVEVYPHLVSGLWLLGGSISTAGRARSWADGILSKEGREGMDEGAPQMPNLSDPLMFIPHLAGARCPQWDPHVRGSWLGLSLNHSSRDLYQAVQEGSVFALRSVLNRMEQLMGVASSLRVSEKEGSPSWQKMRANIYGRSFQPVTNPEPTAQGAMMLAAVMVGMYPDLKTAVTETVSYSDSIPFDGEAAAMYDRLYAKWVVGEAVVRTLRHRVPDP